MSYEESIKSISLDADSSVGIFTGVPGQPGSASPNGGKQYCAVKLTGNHQVGLAASLGSTPKVFGVLQNKPQRPGEAATVCIFGVSNVLSGAAFAAGDYLTTDSAGRFIANGTSGSTTVSNIIAVAPVTGANQLAPALLR